MRRYVVLHRRMHHEGMHSPELQKDRASRP
jgi:hypothetical protein